MAEDRSVAQTSKAQSSQQQVQPPLPKPAYYVVNPVLKAILRSPLHGMVSGALMLLTFRGRKTGKRYSIPVGYLQKDNQLRIFTRSGWWKNLQNGAAVTVRLRGQHMQGTARLIEDPQAVAEVIHELVAKRGEEMARRMGIIADGYGAGSGQPAAPTPGTKFIEIRLAEPAQ